MKDAIHFAGIDPGRTGALAVITPKGRVVAVHDAPIVDTPGKGWGWDYHRPRLAQLARWLASLSGVELALERPVVLAHDSAIAAAKFERGGEVWRSALSDAGVRWIEVLPNVWKSKLGLPGKGTDSTAKRQAVVMARAWFPEVAQTHLVYHSRDHGRAEALLIAHWVRIRSAAGLRAIAAVYGKDSLEARVCILGGLNRQNRRMRTA